jgi:glucose-6-phosphate isomerase, archaeal
MASTLPPNDNPVSVQFDFSTGDFEPCPIKAERKISDLSMMFHDKDAVQALLDGSDPIIYEIRYHPFETSNSDMALGVTVISPGKVGDEYHMTKGHFHEREDRPEIYFCVNGEGYLLMESSDGEFIAQPWSAGTISHIPGKYAHRVINTGDEPLFFVASYNLSAGHIYEPVVERGFAQIVVEREGKAVLIPNPARA